MDPEGRYSLKLLLHPVVPTAAQWADIVAPRVPVPPDLPLATVTGNFQGIGKASSTVDRVLASGRVAFAEEIIRRSGLEWKAQESGYINLSASGRAYAQLHPHPDGLALAIPNADEHVPQCSVLRLIPRQALNGYCGTSRLWLDGKGFTSRPAVAFLIPTALAGRPDHPGWVRAGGTSDVRGDPGPV